MTFVVVLFLFSSRTESDGKSSYLYFYFIRHFFNVYILMFILDISVIDSHFRDYYHICWWPATKPTQSGRIQHYKRNTSVIWRAQELSRDQWLLNLSSYFLHSDLLHMFLHGKINFAVNRSFPPTCNSGSEKIVHCD